MLMVISAAKKLDFSDSDDFGLSDNPLFTRQARSLAKQMGDFSVSGLQNFMGISHNLAELNFARYRNFGKDSEKAAVLAFSGDVYRFMQAGEFSKRELAFANKHLRIISGLYGILRPTDKITAHRLEMGAPLTTPAGEDLYDFWGKSITEHINEALSSMSDSVLVNLASKQYFRSVRRDILAHPVLNIDFKEERDGHFKTTALLAKRARGMMARYAIVNGIKKAADLKGFSESGYKFMKNLSDDKTWVFSRLSSSPL